VLDRYRWETVATFAGHPVVMAAVAANIEWLIEEDAPARARELGARLGTRLEELRERHPSVASVSGAGLLWAVELVRPDGSGRRFVEADRYAIPTGSDTFWPSLFVAGEAAKHGLALATAPPNTLRLGPSLAIAPEVVDDGIERLSAALAALDERR
jgi:taurine--2-oxoglutarate transaminase